MINSIPGFGWLISLAVYASLAVPFWIAWTVFGIGKTYFYFLPTVYHDVGFWATVGIFTVVGIMKVVFVPKLVSVESRATVQK